MPANQQIRSSRGHRRGDIAVRIHVGCDVQRGSWDPGGRNPHLISSDGRRSPARAGRLVRARLVQRLGGARQRAPAGAARPARRSAPPELRPKPGTGTASTGNWPRSRRTPGRTDRSRGSTTSSTPAATPGRRGTRRPPTLLVRTEPAVGMTAARSRGWSPGRGPRRRRPTRERPARRWRRRARGRRGRARRRRSVATRVVGDVELGELLGEAGVAAAGADLLEVGRSCSKPAPGRRRSRRRSGRARRRARRVEQRDVIGARQRLGRLDLDAAVALETGRGRDQLADDDVLLEPREAVLLALDRGVGQDLRRLLEGGSRQERVGVQRGLGDPEDDLLVLRGLAAGRRSRPALIFA